MLPIGQKFRYNPENLAQYSQIVSNCCIKFSAKSVYSNGQDHVFPTKLTFGKVANFIFKVKRARYAKIMSFTKTAIKQSVINIIT